MPNAVASRPASRVIHLISHSNCPAALPQRWGGGAVAVGRWWLRGGGGGGGAGDGDGSGGDGNGDDGGGGGGGGGGDDGGGGCGSNLRLRELMAGGRLAESAQPRPAPVLRQL